MNEQQNSDYDPGLPGNKAELLERIHRSRADLEKTLSSLTEAQLTTPGPEGWSIKDHLAHLAAWEFGVAELLRRRPRFAAMGVEEAVSQGKSEAEINDLIYQRHARLPLPEVLALFQGVHQQLLQTLEMLSEAELLQPYAAFVPEGDDRQDPVVAWVIGNTFEHFDEHHQYIRSLLQQQ